MGLSCSHEAFDGSYPSFNRLRQRVAWATGGSFPPHWKRTSTGLEVDLNGLPVIDRSLDENIVYIGDDYSIETHPGLFEFLGHSDCEGEIAPEMCAKVAGDLERLLPAIESSGAGKENIAARGRTYTEVLRRFIAGCRAAASAGEPLLFE